MSNSFVSTPKNIALIATDIDSVLAAESATTKLSAVRSTLDTKIENVRGQVAELILGQVPLMFYVLDNASADFTAVQQAEAMGINPSHVSKMRTVGTIASHISSRINHDSPAVNLSEAKLIDCTKNLYAWWKLEKVSRPSLPLLDEVMLDFMSPGGAVRCAAVQVLRETFGSVEKVYSVAKGPTCHPDTPTPDQDDDDATTWQGMLTNALNTARKQGATESEVMFIVRAFNNDGGTEINPVTPKRDGLLGALDAAALAVGLGI